MLAGSCIAQVVISSTIVLKVTGSKPAWCRLLDHHCSGQKKFSPKCLRFSMLVRAKWVKTVTFNSFETCRLQIRGLKPLIQRRHVSNELKQSGARFNLLCLQLSLHTSQYSTTSVLHSGCQICNNQDAGADVFDSVLQVYSDGNSSQCNVGSFAANLLSFAYALCWICQISVQRITCAITE